MTLSHHLLAEAYNNGWSNHRLLKACARLTQAEFEAARTSFFPSIKATLNHILTVDWFYIDALEREVAGLDPHPDYLSFFNPEQPFGACASLKAAQAESDRRLIDYCQGLADDTLDRKVAILHGSLVQVETRERLLAHLFQHQIHHRGQVHAMLAGTSVAPPQLDEFFCEMDREARAAEMRELGWDEQAIWL
ncbi:DinB family protein [Massilia cavernae]|uniref:Damage-inducible protein DinB n=1 Tax=Massilia cavernae TaxID=2320864 RepID=A0A418Y172_9BURK|nr:DinB family protein [Massilia cavernae]RJG19211.1 damage-inducible protein DinB [Massilia cavernae]